MCLPLSSTVARRSSTSSCDPVFSPVQLQPRTSLASSRCVSQSRVPLSNWKCVSQLGSLRITDESPRHDVAGLWVRPARVRVAVHITQAVSLGFAGWDMHTKVRAGFCGVGSAVPAALTVTTGREYYM